RTGNVVEIRGHTAVAQKQVAQDFPAADGLRAAHGVERHVVPTLQPVLHVPVREAVADIIDDGPWHELIRIPGAAPCQPRRGDGAHRRSRYKGSSGSALRWASPSFLADIDVGRVRM